MGLDVGGFNEGPDWPRMGPSLLIATCLILAIRTARWPVRSESKTSEMDLEVEIEHAAHLAGRVLVKLVSTRSELFPSRKEPWYQPNDEDEAK